MAYDCKIIKDSVSPTGHRLTTFQVTFPRIILSELRTHRKIDADDEVTFQGVDDAGRALSMNSGSSRAIPVGKIIAQVTFDPFIPIYWGKNQKGMQATKEVTEEEIVSSLDSWLRARDSCLVEAQTLVALGIHKQHTNRLLEPWMWQTCILSATDWSNYFFQRCHTDAQPEIKFLADMMQEAYKLSMPENLKDGYWHLPYITKEDINETKLLTKKLKLPVNMLLCRISTARCARVSYLLMDGTRDLTKDLDLYNKLVTSNHWSPTEHIAQATWSQAPSGNFAGGWQQFRKIFINENVPSPLYIS